MLTRCPFPRSKRLWVSLLTSVSLHVLNLKFCTKCVLNVRELRLTPVPSWYFPSQGSTCHVYQKSWHGKIWEIHKITQFPSISNKTDSFWCNLWLKEPHFALIVMIDFPPNSEHDFSFSRKILTKFRSTKSCGFYIAQSWHFLPA